MKIIFKETEKLKLYHKDTLLMIYPYLRSFFNIYMTTKPPEIERYAVFTYWEPDEGLICPLCSYTLTHGFNDEGWEGVTLKGCLWVVIKYYRCVNSNYELYNAFPMTYNSCLKRKRNSVEVWAKEIQYHFK